MKSRDHGNDLLLCPGNAAAGTQARGGGGKRAKGPAGIEAGHGC